MEKPQDIPPVFDNDDLNKYTEYSFIYSKAEIRKGKTYCLMALLIVTTILAAICFVNPQALEKLGVSWFLIFNFILLVAIPVIFLWFYFPRLRITLNHKGITCAGFWFDRMPKYCAWDEFSQIRVTTFSTKLSWWTGMDLRQLVFIHRYGKQYILPISTRKSAYYVSVGHSLSLEEALELFVGVVEPLSEAEKEKIPAFVGLVDLGKEVGHVAYLALGLAVLAALLGLLPNRPFLFENAIKAPVYWILGLGVAAAACWYMRGIKQKAIMFLPALVIGGMVALLLLPLMSRLPAWFGKEERVVFAIREENEREQRWTAINDAKLTFSVRVNADRRNFKGTVTKREMTLYRGPGSLNALPEHEYRALFHERQRTDRQRKSRDAETDNF